MDLMLLVLNHKLMHQPSLKINLLNRNLRINKNQFKKAIKKRREEREAGISRVDQASLIQPASKLRDIRQPGIHSLCNSQATVVPLGWPRTDASYNEWRLHTDAGLASQSRLLAGLLDG